MVDQMYDGRNGTQLRRYARTFELWGDSLSAQGNVTNPAGDLFNNNRGFGHWLSGLSQQRIQTDRTLNFGVNGETSTFITLRGSYVRSKLSDLIVFWGGANDATFVTNINQANEAVRRYNVALTRAYNTAMSAAKLFMLIVPTPRSISSNLPALSTHFRLMDAARKFAAVNRDVILVDATRKLLDYTSAAGAPLTGITYDGLHLNNQGMPIVAGEALTALAPYIDPIVPDMMGGPASIFDAVYMPDGNVVGADSQMAGTAGTLGANGAGVLADNWTYFANSNGGTVASLVATGSKVTHPVTNQIMQRTVHSGTYTSAGNGTLNSAASVILTKTLTDFSGFQVGGDYEAMCDLIVAADPGARDIAGIELRLSLTMNNGAKVVADGSVYGEVLSGAGYTMRLRTPKRRITSVPTAGSISLRAYLRLNAQTATGSWDAGAPVAYRVPQQ